MLVEDDRPLGATLRERLLREQYDVAWVETKQRASKKLSEGVWDLVIMDINLPDGSGFDLARQIKRASGASGKRCRRKDVSQYSRRIIIQR